MSPTKLHRDAERLLQLSYIPWRTGIAPDIRHHHSRQGSHSIYLCVPPRLASFQPSLSRPRQPTIHTRHHEVRKHLFLAPLALFEAPESSKVFTTGTKVSCILTSIGKQNRVARQGSFKRQLRPFCSLLFMYKLQIAFANIFFKIKSSFLSFLQAPGAWVKQIVLMETRGGGQHPTPFAEAAATPC